MIYIVERINHEIPIEDADHKTNRMFTTLRAAVDYFIAIRDIWPKAEAWLWDTVELGDELSFGSLIAHLNAKEE